MGYRIDVHFAEHDVPCDLTKDVELRLFRVAQEALANVVKHSGAGSAHVDLGTSRHAVSLRISDEARGLTLP
jgi:signal transduction histidine kinase